MELIPPTCGILAWSGGASGKEHTYQHRRYKRLGFNPGVRKISWRTAWQPTPVFLRGKSHGQRSLEGCSPGVAPLDTTERLSTGARLGKEGCNTRKWPQDGAQKRPSPNPRHSRPQEALRASPARGTFPSQGRSCFPGRQGDGDSAPPSRISQGEGRAHRTIQTPCGRAQERAVSSSPGGSSKSMVSKGVGHPHPSVFHAQAGPSLLAP